MKIGIIGILNNPARSLNSHSAGWNEVVRKSISDSAEILTEKDNWNNYDVLIINHGVNFKAGSFKGNGFVGGEVKIYEDNSPFLRPDQNGFNPLKPKSLKSQKGE